MALSLKPIEIVEKNEYQLLAKAPHWERVILKYVAEVHNGFAFKSNFFTKDKGIPLIRIRDISNEYTENYYDGEYEEEYLVNRGDILIGMDGDFNAAFWQGKQGLLNQRVCRIKPCSKLYYEKFLFLCLQPYLNAINAETSSVTVKHLSSQTVEDIPLPLPPLKEQHRIVIKIEELFSELDQGIKNLRIAYGQLKIYQQAVIKQAFEGKLTEQWRKTNADQLETSDRLRVSIEKKREQRYQQQINEWKQAFNAWEATDKKDTKPRKPQKPKILSHLTKKELQELPLLPDEWCWVKLSFLAENIQIGPFGSLLHKSDYITNGTPIINPSHINIQGIEPDWNLSVSPEKLSQLSSFIMRNGDIVIGRRGEMGRCAVVTQKEDGFLCGTGSLFIRLVSENNSDFYFYVLSSQRVKDFLSDQSIGTTMQNLNQEILHNVPVPLCTFSEQQKIVEEIESKMTVISELENIIEENLQKAEVLRQTILKKAFSGHLVAPDPNDEPASILLERIRTERETTPKPIRKTLKNKNKKDIVTMPNLMSVLESAENWLSAKDVFRKCGISDGAETEDIEKLYFELRDLIKEDSIKIERRGDEDWLCICSIKED
ncbi:restriction endonuclease subunit S [Anabaena sp. UHCC 0204]|uniref:restriction endonuclease subunit S n=1 Tax=Anabaena sp. UHCC 0204 TaxID=2590009 RepID=UPI001446D6DA|nr:restriction endonuclease subunit S [Anabaena sp. UHCC 0204]